MSTSSTNNKSQQIGARFPHDVVRDMENSLLNDETKAQFIVTAVRGEIARRQADDNKGNPLLTSLDALARVEEIGTKAGDEIRQLVSVARDELQRRKSKSEPKG
ncbi:YlcI/YnfO family protein [Enterobacter asburiae]|uniref:YlcI/YnfO family protein n=1 Tax=Enterobacter asburiae TaxID=61645 RepID=UPI003F54DBD9